MFLLLSSALEYSLNTKVLTQDIFCRNTKFNPRFRHAVTKYSIGSFISVHAFKNSLQGMLGKRSLATWFTWKAGLLATFCPLYGISSLCTDIKAVSGHEMSLVTPWPVSYHTSVQVSMKPRAGTPEVYWVLEMISNIK